MTRAERAAAWAAKIEKMAALIRESGLNLEINSSGLYAIPYGFRAIADEPEANKKVGRDYRRAKNIHHNGNVFVADFVDWEGYGPPAIIVAIVPEDATPPVATVTVEALDTDQWGNPLDGEENL